MIDKGTPIREQELLAHIAELKAENAFLRARIAELEQQLSKLIDSHDSTKTSDPSPSFPAFVRPKHQKKRHKKPGQKPGHTGSYRQRHMNGRLVRKTLSYSKRVEMLESSSAWEDIVYNLVRPLKTLRLEVNEYPKRWLPRTPAMVAGLTDRIWAIEELLTIRVSPLLL
jgi:hypothetical protein